MRRVIFMILLMIVMGLFPMIAQEVIRGQWRATGISGKYFIDFNQFRNGECYQDFGSWFLRSDFIEGDKGQGEVMTLIRPAGKIIFTGTFQGDKGSGTYEFRPAEGFRKQLVKRGYERPGDKHLFSMAVYGLDESRIDGFEKLNIQGFTLSKLIAFIIHDVDTDYIKRIRQLGYRDISASKLIAFKIHDVTESFIKDIVKLGFKNISPSKLISFKIHGVEKNFIREISNLGYRQISSAHLISFRIHNVTPEFIKSVHRLGYREISSSKLISFKIHGVDEFFIRSIQEKRDSDVSASRLISLKIHHHD